MSEVNKKGLVTCHMTNKFMELADPIIYKRIYADFVKLKWIWSKSFMIFLLERSNHRDLIHTGKALHLDMKFTERDVYERFMVHQLTELKTEFFKAMYGGTLDNIQEAMMNFGTEEYIILQKVIFNCNYGVDLIKGNKVSLTADMRALIEQFYY